MDFKQVIAIVMGATLLLIGWFTLMPGPSTELQTRDASVSTQTESEVIEFGESWFLEFVKRDPEWVSQLRLFGDQSDPTGDQLLNASLGYQREGLEFVKEGLAQLREYDISAQDFQTQTSVRVLEWWMDNQVRAEDFMLHGYVVFPGFGVQNAIISFMTDAHEVHSVRDAENYISRLSKFDKKFAQVHDVLLAQEENDILLPQALIPGVVNGMQGLIDTPPTEHPLYTSFERKLDELSGLSENQKERFLERVVVEINESVNPGYQHIIDFLQRVEPKSPGNEEVGVWRLPNGDAYYKWLVRNHTTTEMTPEEIHQIGLREVERIQEQMIEILEAEGFEGANIQQIFGAYSQNARPDPEWNFPATPEGEAAALAEYHRLIDEVKIKMADAFDILPEAPVEVRPVPDYAAATSPGAYYQPPSFDGSRPGIFYINFANGLPFKPGMQTLTYHEAIPGHHFQLALQQESDLIPDFQKIMIYTVHAEGWALYTEKLAREYDMYEHPYYLLQNLWSELFRAVRLVVDTGLHYKRWSIQETADYMTANLGFPIWGEIYRYVVIPGQALAYKTGELKILELRERARDELGPAFDIAEFHNVVLLNGGMPLEILEDVVDHYIETTLAASN